MEEKTTVRPARLEELAAGGEAAAPPGEGGMQLVQDVRVRLTMSVGGAQLTIGELFALKDGATLELDKATSDPVDVLLDGKLVARGELMVSGEHFAVRITELGK